MPLFAASEMADNLGESGSEALERARGEIAARIEDGKAFAARIAEQAKTLVGR